MRIDGSRRLSVSTYRHRKEKEWCIPIKWQLLTSICTVSASIFHLVFWTGPTSVTLLSQRKYTSASLQCFILHRNHLWVSETFCWNYWRKCVAKTSTCCYCCIVSIESVCHYYPIETHYCCEQKCQQADCQDTVVRRGQKTQPEPTGFDRECRQTIENIQHLVCVTGFTFLWA